MGKKSLGWQGHVGRNALLAGLLSLGALWCLAGTAIATPPQLWQKCDPEDPAIQCNLPRGVAANPDDGHVFVADQNNSRVIELNAVGQFLKTWGWDVVASGPGHSGTGFEICVPENGDVCKAGTSGSGVGQFTVVQGVAVDAAGSIYVIDSSNFRVQKFDPDGNFALMFGDGVNQGPVNPGDICTAQNIEEGDICGAGVSGSGEGQFEWPIARSIITATPSNEIYVGDQGRIQRFDTAGAFQDQCAVEGLVTGLASDEGGNLYAAQSGGGAEDTAKLTYVGGGACEETQSFEIPDPDEFTNPQPTAVAVDSREHVFVFSGAATGNGFIPLDRIFEFDQAGKVIDSFGKGEFDASTGLATNLCEGSDPPGNLYVTDTGKDFIRAYGTEPAGCIKAFTGQATEITETSATLNGTVNPDGEAVSECVFDYGTDETYASQAPCAESGGEIGEGTDPVPVHADIAELTKGTVYHFRLRATVGGTEERGFDETFKTLGPPVISNERTASVSQSEATLKALLNPEGFATTYRFEYVDEETFEAEGFADPEATPTREAGEDRAEHPLTAVLRDLVPGETYHWRLIASSKSGTTASEPHAFTTYLPFVQQACPNEALRGGPAAFLPDCRAYELVSPVDKNGGDITKGLSGAGDPGGYIQSDPAGNKITYTAPVTYGDQPVGFLFNQYLASRGAGGWSSAGVHPAFTGRSAGGPFFGLLRDFMAFSADLCDTWLVDRQTPAPTADGQPGYVNLYRRSNCGAAAGSLEALAPAPPRLALGTRLEYVGNASVQGASEDSGHVFFVSRGAIAQDCASSTPTEELAYQWLRDGEPIAGATAPVYEPGPADVGAALQCQVFALNSNAGSTQVANPAIVIPPGPEPAAPVAPSGISAPARSAPLEVGGPGGQTLTCDPKEAQWGGEPAISFAWYRNAEPIAGATEAEYTVSEADVATPAAFQCAVSGTNAGGTVVKASTNRTTSPAPSAPGILTANATTGGDRARIYERSGGELHLASVLPGGRVDPATAAVGSGWSRNLHNAVSADGSRLYWTSGIDNLGKGTVYLRQNPARGIEPGECEAPQRACTRKVSGLFPAFFWGAADEGSKALYTELDLGSAGLTNLFAYDLAADEAEGGTPRRLIAKGVIGVPAHSEDLSRVYFVSREALEGEAVEGEPNLYLDEEGTVSFIARLAEGDVGGVESDSAYNLASQVPYLRPARTTPDGGALAFQSRAALSEYDNRAAQSGEAAVEVYRYEAASGELRCVSCNPSGARPQTREMAFPYEKIGELSLPTNVQAAAWIPTWEHPLHASNVLSADGKRLFFNSNDALVARDTNGTQDVYEWEAAGTGSCTEASPSFFEQNGGCVYLISTGDSRFESEFWEADRDGSDVFFTTESSLLPQDPGLIDLYDARVGGGIPRAPEPAPCEGEACQNPPAPPDYPDPASGSFSGPGNPVPPPRSCAARARRAIALSRRAKGARRAARRSRGGPAAQQMRRKARRLARAARRQANAAKRCRRANGRRADR